jgi:hypothetical protein
MIPDFFLWGYLKDRVYAHSIANIQDLQQCIRIEVNKINNNLTSLRNVYNSFYERIQLCIEKNGQYLNKI